MAASPDGLHAPQPRLDYSDALLWRQHSSVCAHRLPRSNRSELRLSGGDGTRIDAAGVELPRHVGPADMWQEDFGQQNVALHDGRAVEADHRTVVRDQDHHVPIHALGQKDREHVSAGDSSDAAAFVLVEVLRCHDASLSVDERR